LKDLIYLIESLSLSIDLLPSARSMLRTSVFRDLDTDKIPAHGLEYF